MKMAADAIERSEGAVWSGMQRVLARFLFCYFVLYYGPTLLGAVPGAGFLVGWSSLLRYKLVGLVMVHVIGLDSYWPQLSESGDTAASYVIQIIILVAAFGGALVWSLLERSRTRPVRLRGWLQVLARYALAFSLIGYALAKIIPVQFSHLQARQLAESYGQSSPMALLWNFMGFSTAYTVFGGVAELVPAMLLLFRRTALAGALIAFGVLLNVVMLNLCYDVPVKLHSLNLLLLSVFLVLPESGRLLRIFVLNRPVPAVDLGTPAIADTRVRGGATVLKYVCILFLIGGIALGSVKRYRATVARGETAATPLTSRGFHWVQEYPYYH
jgi:hypothetical protein